VIFISLEPVDIAVGILIGGKSTRFGSDKGLFKIGSKPMISFQIETISKLNYKIYLVAKSANQMNEYINKINIEKISGFIIDERESLLEKGIHTPMIGLYTVFKDLNKLGFARVLILSCDMPLVKLEVIQYLLKFSNDFECIIPIWDNGYLEPLFSIYPVKKGLESAIINLKRREYKLTKLIRKDWKIKYVSVEKELKKFDENLISFININKIEDLGKLKGYLIK
jgi:molybdopterin-guanine dinucleotide biosynthesis protein A